MENLEQFAAKAQTQYQIRPPFKQKFRPAEGRAAIEKLLPDLVRQYYQRKTQGSGNPQASRDDGGDDESGEDEGDAEE